MKTVKKKEGKTVKAYCLGEDSPVIHDLTEKGMVRQTDGSHWRIFSQEATNGEEAEAGDYIKIDSSGKPYPNSREFFLKNHRPLGGDAPLKAWDIKGPPCRELEFLISRKGLSINESDAAAYFSAPLWGDTLTAAKDAVIIFYSIQYDDGGDVTDADFNFVARNEFDRTYEIL